MSDMEIYPYREIIASALAEDIRSGDVTSLATIPAGNRGRGAMFAREALVVSALDVAGACFEHLDPDVRFETQCVEGQRVEAGFRLATIDGDLRAMLAGERTSLNLVQRACGIATRT